MSNDTVNIDGEDLGASQIEFYRRTLKNDCVKFAGEFHGMNRSKKFRANWPNEYEFADRFWKKFVSAVRQLYAQQLANPHTPEESKKTIHRCLVIDAMTNAELEKSLFEMDNSLQLAPNTQQFIGDKKENAGISENWGDEAHPLRKALLSTGARFH